MCNFSVWFAVGLVCVGLQCWGESENVAFDLHCTVRKTQYSLQLALDLYFFYFMVCQRGIGGSYVYLRQGLQNSISTITFCIFWALAS